MNILITGGSSGLGAAITQELAKEASNTVYFTYHKSISKAQEICQKFSNTKAIKCDFTNSEELDELLSQIENLDIDVLINNAVTSKIDMKHFDKVQPSYFVDGFTNNILPTIRISQKCFAKFKKKKSGRVITVLTSFLLNKPPLGCAEYVAAKAYLASLAKSWANEYIKYNISSNCISPSFMQTDFTSDTDERVIEEQVANHPLKKLLSTEEVAASVSYLVHCSLHVNGINLVLNAGSNLV